MSNHNPSSANYGLVAFDESGEILHYVGFWAKPTLSDFRAIRDELKTDPEFGLRDLNWELRPATEEEVKKYQEIASRAEVKTHDGPMTFEEFTNQ